MMIVIPAIDISKGKCTQLVGGKPETAKYYGDPVKVAKKWEDKGAHLLHIIDLDATLGIGGNADIIREIKKAVDIPIQVGGGIRDEETARIILDEGVDRVILGTLAVKDPKVVRRLSTEYSNSRLMVAVDSSDGKVVIKGWQEKTKMNTVSLVNRMKPYVFGFLLTDVDREGQMKGIDLDEFTSVYEATGAKIIASGGVTSTQDVIALQKAGIWGCVVGKALYEGKIDESVVAARLI
jgi:phosphoribosylformimino-5-aminoimidazole carboxamide ribotide isomerase